MRPEKSTVFRDRHGVWHLVAEDPQTGRARKTRLFRHGDTVPPSKQSRRQAERRAAATLEQWGHEARERERRANSVALSVFFEQAIAEGEVSTGQRSNRRIAFGKFATWLGTRCTVLTDVTVGVVDKYLAHLAPTVKPATFDREVSILRRAFNYAVERDLLAKNPVVRPTRRKTREHGTENAQGRAFTDKEIAQVFVACHRGVTVSTTRHRRGKLEKLRQHFTPPTYLLPCLQLLNETAMRPGELVQLRWDAVNLDERLIHIRAETCKTGIPRDIPITDVCFGVLQELKRTSRSQLVVSQENGLPLDRRALSRVAKRLFGKLGIKKSLYGFRHAALFRIASAGLPLHKLMKVAGHRKLTTTQIYLASDVVEFRDEFIELMARGAGKQRGSDASSAGGAEPQTPAVS